MENLISREGVNCTLIGYVGNWWRKTTNDKPVRYPEFIFITVVGSCLVVVLKNVDLANVLILIFIVAREMERRP